MNPLATLFAQTSSSTAQKRKYNVSIEAKQARLDEMQRKKIKKEQVVIKKEQQDIKRKIKQEKKNQLTEKKEKSMLNKFLLRQFNYKNITEFRKKNKWAKNVAVNEIYQNLENKLINSANLIKKIVKNIAMRNKMSADKFRATVPVRMRWKLKNGDGSRSIWGKWYDDTDVEIGTKSQLKNFIDQISFSNGDDDYYEKQQNGEVIFEHMDTGKIMKNVLPILRQPMKRAFIIKNNWLHYAKNIHPSAYEETNNMCSYNQLSQMFLNPPTKRPLKKIGHKKTSPESIYEYVLDIIDKNGLNDVYPNFKITDGITVELVSLLCRSLDRSMYAYDGNNKCFESVVMDSFNYCPVIFYKMNQHMYLVSDKDANRSVAESNKISAKQIQSSSSVPKEKDNDEEKCDIFPDLESFDAKNCHLMPEGLYLIKKSNLIDEVRGYFCHQQDTPITRSSNSKINQFTFKNKDNKKVTIVSDNTPKLLYLNELNEEQEVSYYDWKMVAERAGIKDYVNQGAGSIINSAIAPKIAVREYISDENKNEMMCQQNGQCAICEMSLEEGSYDVDHIIALAAGGSNEQSNLQLICKKCHVEKTNNEKTMDEYCIKDQTFSHFNEVVIDNVYNSNYINALQFVEKVNTVPKIKTKEPIYHTYTNLFGQELKKIKKYKTIESDANCYKIDICKCRRNGQYYSKHD